MIDPSPSPMPPISTEGREIRRVEHHPRDALHRIIVRIDERDESRLASTFEEHRAIAEAVIRGDEAGRSGGSTST